MKKANIILFGLLIFFLPLTVQAYTVKTGKTVHIQEGEKIEGNLYIGAEEIIIDGEIMGDLICGGDQITVNGKINGDIICGASQVLNLNGEIGGNARVAGDTINFKNKINKNVNAFGMTINLEDSSQVGGDVLMAGVYGNARGKIEGSFHGVASSITVAGLIGKDLRFNLDSYYGKKSAPLTIFKDAEIKGNLNYTSEEDGVIVEGAKINGQVEHHIPEKKPSKTFWQIAWERLYSIFSALIVGLVLISLWPKQSKEISAYLLETPGKKMAWGALLMFVTPFASLVLILTLIGLPLALIILILWLIAIYLSKIFVGIAAGKIIIKKIKPKAKPTLMLIMITGVVTTWIIYTIPVLGWVLGLLAVWWGLGGILIYCKENK